MHSDLFGSMVLHGAVVVLFGLWTPMMSKTMHDDQTLPIDIITVDEFTRIIEESRERDRKEPVSKAAPETAAHEVTPPPAAAPANAMPELDTRAKPEKSVLSEKPVPAPRTAKPVPSKPRVEKPESIEQPSPKLKSLLDVGQVRALLDKIPEVVNAPRQDKTAQPLAAAERLTLSEIDAFRTQMKRCWSPPSGARDAEMLMVRVRLSLSPAGSILAGPVVVNRDQLGNPFFRAAAESVLRAIRRCQPFSMPVEKYAGWRNIELTFNPRKMLGR